MSTEASDAAALPSNIVRTLPYTLYVSAAGYAATFASGDAAVFLVGLVANEVSNHIAKALCKRVFGKNTIWIKRPEGAMDTGIYPSHQPKISTTSGMPSGHSQTAWFAATLLLRAIIEDDSRSGFSMAMSCIFVLGIATLTAASRTRYGGIFTVRVNGTPRPAHTVAQVVLGGAIGIANAILVMRYFL